MKLVTFKPAGASPQLGLIVGDSVVNLSAASGGRLPNDMRAFLEMGEPAMEVARTIAGSRNDADAVVLSGVKLMAPILNPSKVVAIGLNYMDHVRESGIAPPTIATMFTKYPSSIIGPGDAIRWDPARDQRS